MVDRWKEAAREAYVVAPAEDLDIATIELFHSTWTHSERVAAIQQRPDQPFMARLEASAPRDGGQLVAFTPMAFRFDLPPQEGAAVPELSVTIDGVTAELVEELEGAAASGAPTQIIYRPYLLSTADIGPSLDPPLIMELSSIQATMLSVTGHARIRRSGDGAFPRLLFTQDRVPAIHRT